MIYTGINENMVDIIELTDRNAVLHPTDSSHTHVHRTLKIMRCTSCGVHVRTRKQRGRRMTCGCRGAASSAPLIAPKIIIELREFEWPGARVNILVALHYCLVYPIFPASTIDSALADGLAC